ncbi:glycoside hydrolase family 5 protein [Aulographum hederae CBS 113979]|uniref:Glycoside hydrolase family 5 protein n=1 Tax=Aulographum hederae CBS 113979 TaxID=1176131 RepID=A0A6G1GQ54_9PEZI|nr:glycoside hydrolase family 5 protein [Aulographum hederae CBS 113979]
MARFTLLSALFAASLAFVDATPFRKGVRAVTCSETWEPVTAQDFVDRLNPGWNLGNSLDATPGETDWGNKPVTGDIFDLVKESGFKSVRLPVTWTNHTGPAPDYTIDASWLTRVSEVIDMVLSRDMYAIVNMHHDSFMWADISKPDSNISEVEDRFRKLWVQIADKLACKSSRLAFEPINEPPGTTEEHGMELNKINDIFLETIGASGGFNDRRVVTLSGAGQDSIKTSQWFKRPANITNPWAIQYHYYSPYDFNFGAWGRTIWGSDADKASLDSDLKLIRDNFTDVPLVIGEWQVTPFRTEAAARWKYFDFFIRTANKYRTSTIIWDNGGDFLDRPAKTWRDVTALNILMDAVKGLPNALPDSTTDQSAPTQWTAATIFHRVGAPVEDATLPFLLNNDTVTRVDLMNTGTASIGSVPRGQSVQYRTVGSNITIPANVTAPYLSASAAPGSKPPLTITFTNGAPIQIQLVQWDTPVLSTSTVSLPPASATELAVPITWKGLKQPAAVRAVTVDDQKPIVDDWTAGIGSLQAGFMTYDGQWKWNDTHVILAQGALEAMGTVKRDVVVSVQGWPREEGNMVNFTVTAAA